MVHVLWENLHIALCKKYGTIPKTMELWLPMGIAMVNLKTMGLPIWITMGKNM